MAKNSKKKQREYDEKRAGQRTRNWTVIFYPEDLPEDWKEKLDNLHVRWIEGPLHDNDVNADGAPKKPHVHTLIMFEAIKSVTQVTEILGEVFGVSENGTIIGAAVPQKVGDRGSIVRYMAHLDNPEKAQYDVKDIVGHNGADPAELLRYSATETRLMVIAIEEFIQDNCICNLMQFSEMIRYEHPEWHTLVSTRMTVWFKSLIEANRHFSKTREAKKAKAKKAQELGCDPDTGEVIEDDVKEDQTNGEV